MQYAITSSPVSAARQTLSFGLCCSNTTPTLSEIQIKLLFYPKQYMVETLKYSVRNIKCISHEHPSGSIKCGEYLD